MEREMMVRPAEMDGTLLRIEGRVAAQRQAAAREKLKVCLLPVRRRPWNGSPEMADTRQGAAQCNGGAVMGKLHYYMGRGLGTRRPTFRAMRTKPTDGRYGCQCVRSTACGWPEGPNRGNTIGSTHCFFRREKQG